MLKEEIAFIGDTALMYEFASVGLTKRAQSGGGMVAGLTESVKEYVSSHIDPNNRFASIMNILAPGAISMAFKAMGHGWLGLLLGTAVRMFNIDIGGILSNIYNELRSALGSKGENQITSSHVQNIVNNAVQQQSGEMSLAQISDSDIRLLKLAMLSDSGMELNKLAASRGQIGGLLAKVLGWVFKVALASAGFLVAGDVVNHFLGRPNPFDGTLQQGHPVGEGDNADHDQQPINIVNNTNSTQTIFRINPNYNNQQMSGNWIEQANNTEAGIADMLQNMTNQVYMGVPEGAIKNSSNFQQLINDIAFYNHSAVGDNIVFIPKQFHNKKELVDQFIDQVASQASAAA